MSFDHEQAKINVLSDEDVKRWSVYFNISDEQLRNAVFIAGPLVQDVREFLLRKGLISNR